MIQTSNEAGPKDVIVQGSSPMSASSAPSNAKGGDSVMGVPPAAAQGTSAAQRGCNSKEGLFNIGFLVLMFVLFYFMLIRPQQKQQKERDAMLASLKKGDRVVTSGGLIGTITTMGDDVLTLEISDRVRVRVLRSAVVRKVEETKTKNEKTAKEK